MTVRIIEMFDRLLPRQMDPDGAAILQKKMEEMGFEFHLGVKTQEIAGGPEGAPFKLILDSGTEPEGDMVLISAGVRPYLDLAKKLDLEIGRGITVNDRMETSMSGVYAAGDAVEHAGVYYGIWPAAGEQGRTAGLNMAGGDAEYKGTPMSNALKVVGIDLVAAGDIDAEGQYESDVVKDPDKGVYRKIVYKDGLYAGCILLGDVSGQKGILEAIANQEKRK